MIILRIWKYMYGDPLFSLGFQQHLTGHTKTMYENMHDCAEMETWVSKSLIDIKKSKFE